jgi:tryptophan-rich sensory protein
MTRPEALSPRVQRVAAPPGRRVDRGGLLTGLGVLGGAICASALVSAIFSPAPGNQPERRFYERLDKPAFTPPDPAFAIWGPLYAALLLSGLRIWNAPPGADRDRALAHWFGIQGLNALWLWLGFGQRRLDAMTLEGGVTVANAAAYVATADRVDRPAALLGLPYLAWIAFAALLSEELWRRNGAQPAKG